MSAAVKAYAKLTEQQRLITLGQQLLTGVNSVTVIFEQSGYSGIVVEDYLSAELDKETLIVRCQFPDEGDTGPEDNVGNVYITIDGNEFKAEF